MRACAITFCGLGHPSDPISVHCAAPHACVVRGRSISSTKVKALPESLGQCKLLGQLCVRTRSRRPPFASPAVRAFVAVPAVALSRGRLSTRRGRTVARRYASNTELAALPAVAQPDVPVSARAAGARPAECDTRAGGVHAH